MNLIRRIAGSWSFLFAVATILAPMIAGNDSALPNGSSLTNDDVVRMVVAGTAEGEILESIRTHVEAFDLTEDMIEELRLAGVPPTVVAAMMTKHALSVTSPPPGARPRPGSARLVVTLNSRGSGARTLRVPSWADEDARARWRLPKENDKREVKDIAVFLACTSPEHIPDLWRSKTPLGRDMSSVVRHEILAFVAGDTPAGKQPRLTLPEHLEAEIDGTEPHDLLLGVAARIGDHWIQLSAVALRAFTLGTEPKVVAGHIERSGHGFDFKIELTAPR